MTQTQGEPVSLWSMAELGCWFMVVLAPFLTWVNGPPVSTDQAVVRTIVFTLALTGGVALAIRRLLFRKGRQSTAKGQADSETGHSD